MKRVIVIGTTGSGKSTLAHRLAEKRGLKYIDLDNFHHMPGWKERPVEEFRSLVETATQAEKWVIAGNYSKSQNITWPKADTLIWLDISFWLNFWQLLRRSFRRIYMREMICNGNKENLGKLLSKDSILWWFLKTWHKNRKRYGSIFDSPKDYPHLNLIRLTSYQQSNEFIRQA